MYKESSRLLKVPYSGLLMHQLSDTVWRCLHRSIFLSDHDREILTAGIDFLDRVQEGADILHRRAGLVPNIDSISAYTYATQGLGPQERRTLFSSRVPGEVFAHYCGLLMKFREGKPTGEAERENATEALAFFERLGDLAFSSIAIAELGDEEEWTGILEVLAA